MKFCCYFLQPLIRVVLIADGNFNGSIPLRKSNSKAETSELHRYLHGFAAALSIDLKRLVLVGSNLAWKDCINHVFVISSQIFFSVWLSTNSACHFLILILSSQLLQVTQYMTLSHVVAEFQLHLCRLSDFCLPCSLLNISETA